MSGIAEALRALERVFAGLGARWYVFGAQAAIFPGVARATADVDVTLDPAGHAPAAIVGALKTGGFRLRIEDPEFVVQTRVLPVVHAGGVPVDVILAGPGIEELFFERVVHRIVDGTDVPIASAEDVVVMKVLAGRPKDLEDVRGIVSANRRSLDAGHVRAMLDLLERALDRSDLLPIFENILAEAR